VAGVSLLGVDAQELFEAELARRGVAFSVTQWPGQYEVRVGEFLVRVSLDNLARQVSGNAQDAERVTWFTEQVLTAVMPADLAASGLYWLLESNDYTEKAWYRASVSPRLDRVLAHVSSDGSLIRMISEQHLAAMNLTIGQAGLLASANLDTALREAEISGVEAPGDVTLAVIATTLPSKASLLLAPSLREAVSPVTEWPVLAVAPDRDFVYVWNADRRDLIARMGPVVIREHARAPYPLTTEILHISDTIHAIGAYTARPDAGNGG
jgi:hypothetical protein